MRKIVAATAAGVLSAGLVAAVPSLAGAASDEVDTSGLTQAVQVNGVLQHLRAFQDIANANDGNRASGLPGYDASVAYVTRTLKAAGYQVTQQTFTFPFFDEKEPATFTRLTPTRKRYETSTFTYSGSGDVRGVVVPTKDVVIPASPTPSSTSGCEAADFPTAPSGAAIALVQRGTCDFAVKAANAKAAGYEAAAIFNEGNPERTELLAGTLGAPTDIPVVGLSYADGAALVKQTQAGAVTARVTTSTESDLERETKNVLAQWPGTTANDDQVLVVGAHLDSVTEGAGINDNGSGSAGILEIAEQMAATGAVNKLQRPVRFAFWGAEELGLLGSEHYVASLTSRQKANIYANLNFDMLGSPNYVRLVYDGDGSSFGVKGPAGSTEIESVFKSYFRKAGLPTDPTAFDGRSDYGPFIAAGIPAGGLFSGADDVKTPRQARIYGGTAGETLDQNYHSAEDDITNINTTVLGQLTDGAAHAVATIALGSGLYGDATVNRTAQRTTAVDPRATTAVDGPQAVR